MRLALFVMFLVSSPAFADQSPTEQALGQKLIAEISASVSCSAKVIELEKRIKDLESKEEKK